MFPESEAGKVNQRIMSRIEEINLDIKELTKLMEIAMRHRSKDVLSLEIRRLQTELSKLEQENIISSTENTPKPNVSKCYECKITNYCWDQNDKFVKIYVMLNNVHTLPEESVACNFGDRSMDLQVFGLENRNYRITINNLCEDIVPVNSFFKIGTNKITVSMSKKESRTWSHITGIEKQIKESKTNVMPEMDENADVGASLMNMMKKLYQEGNDDMKKSIAKAWTESQEKKSSTFDNMPGF